MPMSFSGEHLDLIIYYDAITCYTKVDNMFIRHVHSAAMQECQQLDFIETCSVSSSSSEISISQSGYDGDTEAESLDSNSQVSATDTIPNEEAHQRAHQLGDSVEKVHNFLIIPTNNLNYDRSVNSMEDVHELYHQDEDDRAASHWHLKFKSFLELQKVGEVLDVLINHQLFTTDEKVQFFREWSHRYNEFFGLRNILLVGNKQLDYQGIFLIIKSCFDNDLLHMLHVNLLLTHYDYLREFTPQVDDGTWQGTISPAGITFIVITSYVWVMIEKALSLQMGHNIVSNCQFTPEVAAEKFNQLQQHHAFFALKRKLTGHSGRKINAAAIAFAQGDGETFERYYHSYFSTPQSYRQQPVSEKPASSSQSRKRPLSP